MRLVLAMSVLLVGASARADSECKAGKGTPMLETRWSSGPAKVVTKVFASGAVTRAETRAKDAPKIRSRTYCLSDKKLDEIKAALKAAKWKKTKQQAQCLGVDSDTIDFYVAGVKRYRQRTCGLYEVDEASTHTIELIGNALSDGYGFPIIPPDWTY
jgi:hypothetical protein